MSVSLSTPELTPWKGDVNDEDAGTGGGGGSKDSDPGRELGEAAGGGGEMLKEGREEGLGEDEEERQKANGEDSKDVEDLDEEVKDEDDEEYVDATRVGLSLGGGEEPRLGGGEGPLGLGEVCLGVVRFEIIDPKSGNLLPIFAGRFIQSGMCFPQSRTHMSSANTLQFRVSKS